MASLPNVAQGDLHVAAHNDERSAINDLKTLTETGRLSQSQQSAFVTALVASGVPPVVAQALAADSTVANAAATAAATAVTAFLAGKAVPTTQDLGDDSSYAFAAMYPNREAAFAVTPGGDYYPVPKTSQEMASFKEDVDGSGWRWYIRYADREVAFGQRTDGSYYPDSLSGTSTLKYIQLGDSMVGNWSGANSLALNALLGNVPFINTGIGGQTSYEIAGRDGGSPAKATVTGGIIPTSGSVTVTLDKRLRSDNTPVGCLIQGVAGAFVATDTTTYKSGTFTRTLAATYPTVVPAGSPVQTGFDTRDYVPIIWMGRNNWKRTDSVNKLDYYEQIITDINNVLSWHTPTARSKALIFAIPPWAGEEYGSGIRNILDTANAAIRDAFPTRFLDLPAMLRNADTMTAFGYPPTSQDLTDIANGITPTTLRATLADTSTDAGHWNTKGYDIANHLVADFINARGGL